MKRALVFSLILHIILLSAFFFLKEERKKTKEDYFHTRLISPDELRAFQERISPQRLPVPKEKIVPQKKPERIKPSPVVPNIKPLSRQKKTEQEKEAPKKLDQEGKTTQERSDTSGKQTISPELSGKKDNLADRDESGKKARDTPGSRLFDKEVIGKLAQKEREQKPDSSITFSTKEYQYLGYMQRLKEKIEGIWKYPRDAAERGIYGDLYIRFTIKKNGRLGAVELIRTSGYKSLDDAAMRALRDAEPYWPLPDEWGRDGLTITGHFVYTYYGSYIR